MARSEKSGISSSGVLTSTRYQDTLFRLPVDPGFMCLFPMVIRLYGTLTRSLRFVKPRQVSKRNISTSRACSSVQKVASRVMLFSQHRLACC